MKPTHRMPWTGRRAGLMALLVLLALPLAWRAAAAGFGSPIMETGRFGLGVVGHSFTRDVYDVEEDALSNPEDTFAYVALEARLGIWRERLDLSVEVGRAHNSEDEFADRDYITYELGLTVRGLVYEQPAGRFDLLSGLHYRDTIGFDRGPSQTHKLRRNLAVFGYVGRRIELGGRPGRVYAGPHYSRHEFDDYGEFFRPGRGPGEGETRDNLQLAGGLSLLVLDRLELSGHLTYRNNLSLAVGGMLMF